MSMADELKKLADLKDQGLLSQDEYDSEKSKLLGGAGSSPAPAAGPPAPQFVPMPMTYLAHAIFATLFCFLPTGIVAIIKASGVTRAHQAGNYVEAVKLSNAAQLWVNLSVVLGILIYVLIGALK